MIDFNIERIVPLCREFGIELDNKKIEQLNTYGNLLLEWNEEEIENSQNIRKSININYNLVDERILKLIFK